MEADKQGQRKAISGTTKSRENSTVLHTLQFSDQGMALEVSHLHLVCCSLVLSGLFRALEMADFEVMVL